jgi:tetratricopeptide (TPR) repeat protein
MGAVKDSLRDLNKAIKLNPSRTDAYAVMAECYDQLRQLPKAISSYRTALAREPERGEWWFRLASILADSGQRAEAGAAVKRAIAAGDGLEPVPYWLPGAYRLAGENAEHSGQRQVAIRLYKSYLELAPESAIDLETIEKKLEGWGVRLEEDEF